MEKIKYYLEKYRIIIIVMSVILILLVSILYTVFHIFMKKEVVQNLEIKEDIKVKEEVKIEEKVKVDIKGYVEKPGVYEMNNNDRVIDVITKAGGVVENSNTEYINLSKRVVDEMIIIIYSNDDVEKFKETDKEIIYIEYECICPDNKNEACITESDTVNTNGVTTKEEGSKEISNDDKDNLVSINKGTLEDLMTLSGIGESKAQAIIDYREENGEFEKLEDIMNVSGIGESAYSKIKDNIKL